MDEATKAFVKAQNVARYVDLIKTEDNPAKRETLLKLLAQEEAKLLKPST
jgi:hypothetical protein